MLPWRRDLATLRATWPLLGAWLLVTTSCNPQRFDDLAAKAPVQVAESPEDLSAFGPAAVAPALQGSPNETVSGIAVVAGRGTEALVSVRVLSDGRLETWSGADLPGFGGEVTGLAVTTPRMDPYTGLSRPAVLVGVPSSVEGGGVYLALVDPEGHLMALDGPTFTNDSCVLPASSGFGARVAAGDMDGDGSDEWLVVSHDSVCIFPHEGTGELAKCDGLKACSDCPFSDPRFRSAVFGAFLEPDRQAAAVGVPNSESGGTVALLTSDASGQTCSAPGSLDIGLGPKLTAPDSEPTFGWALAAAPDQASGMDGLLVAAPGRRTVYLYPAPVSDATWTVAVELDQETEPSDSFGRSLLVADLLGDPSPELVVGAPESLRPEADGHGAVYVFEGLGPGTWAQDPAVVLTDFETGRSDLFGQALTVVKGPEDEPVLMVVAKDAVFAYAKSVLENLAGSGPGDQ